MLESTRGIVFQTIKYADSGIIAKIYTEQFGLQSYLVRGLHSKKSQLRNALFQPMNLVELVASHRINKDLQYLKEIRISCSFSSIPFDIRKSTTLMFLNEVICQVVREEEANPALFGFLFDAIRQLDIQEEQIALFHLVFLIQFTRYLGFFPGNHYSDTSSSFHLAEGLFTSRPGPENQIAGEPYGSYIAMLSNSPVGETGKIKIPVDHRGKLLDYIILYYYNHLPGMREIKSHVVLREVLNG